MRAAHLLGLAGLIACGGAGTADGAQVRPGIEVLVQDSLHLVRGRRLGLLTNHTGIDRAGRRDVDVLRETPGVRLVLLWSPEHGFRGTEDREGLPDAVDSASGLPIYSMYRGAGPPNLAGLDSVDVVAIDLQDIGARYYTYVSSAAQLLREAARRGVRVVVLDRPNPLGGEIVQGAPRPTVGDPDRDFVGFLPVPMRHGLTLGELLRMTNDLLGLAADLRVVPAAGWRRGDYGDATGLPWVRPSPNMPDLESAMHYPGTCLFEGTNLSVGRGTGAAFQVLGAPWLAPRRIIAWIGRTAPEALTGVAVAADSFTALEPTDGKYAGIALPGLRLRVTDRGRYDATRLAMAILAALRAVHPDSFLFRAGHFDRLAAGPELRVAVLAGATPQALWAPWDAALARFRESRAKYLVY
jgi:uncharacterized protein YbbC (DUF1343 family)